MSNGRSTRLILLAPFLLAGMLPDGRLAAYPLDGYAATGIRRLEAFRRILSGEAEGTLRLPPGARLRASEVRLQLADLEPGRDPTLVPDAELQPALEALFTDKDPSYRIALLDITHPDSPRFAALRADQGLIPGSVGKLLVMASLFHQCRLRFPGDFAQRSQFLRTVVAADSFTGTDHHRVPIVDDQLQWTATRPIQMGDRFSLWEWMDHMVSPSSNSAASMAWKEAVLMDLWGPRYPADQADNELYFRTSTPQERTDRAVQVVRDPIEAAGLRFEQLRVQTLFTRAASRVIPGRASYATPLELLRWLIRLEQGRLVDRWSSLEMKKLMYFTRPRYRYASAPALNQAAVYFKSGSLFECEPEEGFRCVAYQGNRTNLMHSVAIVESPAQGDNQVIYLIAMMSNVLRVNSAVQHQEIAGEIERLVRRINRR